MDPEADLLRRAHLALAAGSTLPPELRSELDDLFSAYRPRLHRVCARWTNDPVRGEELAHDAIAVAWSKLENFRFEGSFFNFLVEIARNLQRNARRKMHDLLSEDGMIDPLGEERSALASLRDDEREAVLLGAISDLPQVEQDALYLRYFEGLSYAEIDERLDLSTRAGVRGLLVVAKRHLANGLRAALLARGHGSSFFRTTTT